ncbi:MAG: hypothetical protein ABIK73_07920 [candidate division WOR-3 bacterium]
MEKVEEIRKFLKIVDGVNRVWAFLIVIMCLFLAVGNWVILLLNNIGVVNVGKEAIEFYANYTYTITFIYVGIMMLALALRWLLRNVIISYLIKDRLGTPIDELYREILEENEDEE